MTETAPNRWLKTLEELKKTESGKKILKMKKKKPDKENAKVVKAENPCDVKMVWQSPLSEETIPKFEPKLAQSYSQFLIKNRKTGNCNGNILTGSDTLVTLPKTANITFLKPARIFFEINWL